MNPQKDTPTHSPDRGISKDTTPCIFVIEDDRAVAEMLEASFRKWGYEVLVARNGQEGLDVVATQSVDGILLNIHLPIMDGRTMFDELRCIGH